MEEGPEPQEWVERTVEDQHHGHHESAGGHQSPVIPAVTAAVLAVLAALGSLLSGHAANQAILGMSKANDQWSLFQSKSTKGHLYEVGAQIVSTLGRGPDGKAAEPAGVEKFRAEAKRYEEEKADIEREAKAIEAESAHEFHKHHRYALGVAAFQVGIVLASISMLVRVKALYLLSLAAGVAGLLCVALGLVA
jgi:Domain of unknown function (DUF4337)